MRAFTREELKKYDGYNGVAYVAYNGKVYDVSRSFHWKRARPAAIKSKLGVGESTIRKHMKKMLSNGMFRIVVVPNPELLEYAVWATMGINISNRPGHEILDDIVKHPEVYLASVSIGRFNLVIAAHFHSIDFLHRFVTVELPAIQGVGHVETFLHNKPLKYHNIKWSI